jgi:hypothetical protein
MPRNDQGVAPHTRAPDMVAWRPSGWVVAVQPPVGFLPFFADEMLEITMKLRVARSFGDHGPRRHGACFIPFRHGSSDGVAGYRRGMGGASRQWCSLAARSFVDSASGSSKRPDLAAVTGYALPTRKSSGPEAGDQPGATARALFISARPRERLSQQPRKSPLDAGVALVLLQPRRMLVDVQSQAALTPVIGHL